MGTDNIFNIEPFLVKNDSLISVGDSLNVESFISQQISVNEITYEMMSFFTNDKCNRELLSNFENKYVIISGKYERFGYNYPNNMSVQDCHLETDGQIYSLGHMWWQNIHNSDWLNINLTKGSYVTGIGRIHSYKCNDENFPCDKSYGISNVFIL